MKEKALLFTKEEFQDFMLRKMQENFPHINFTIQEHFSIEMKKDSKLCGVIHLNNAWNAYETSSDLNEVIHYLEAIVATQNYIEGDGVSFTFPQDQQLVYPAIRSTDYAKEELDVNGNPQSLIFKEDLAEDIMLMYIMDHPKFVVAITEDMLAKNVKNEQNEHLSDTEIKTTSGYQYLKELVIETAWQNQKKRGWVKHALKKKNIFGIFYHFFHPEYEYQSQFFIKEWTKKHLGPMFYITFPTKNSTLVLVPSSTTQQVREMTKKLLQLDTQQIIQKERNYITSPHIYYLHQDKKITIV